MDPWRIGARMRHWRKQRGLSTRVFADLIGRSPSWVQMAETGHRSPYNIIDLINIARALNLDLGTLLTAPVPGVADEEQQQMLALLHEAFAGSDPNEGLKELARSAGLTDAEDDLMLVVEPGGRLRIVKRRAALQTGGLVGITLAASFGGWLDLEAELTESAESRTIGSGGVRALQTIIAEYRRLDDEIGPEVLRPGVGSHLKMVRGLKGAGKTSDVERDLGRVAGELEQLSGWLAYNSGDHRAATRHYRNALSTARATADDALASYTLGFLGILVGNSGRFTEAVDYTRAGVERARRTGSRRLTAASLLRCARANAQAGNGEAVKTSINEARDELTDTASSEDPSFVYWFDQTELDGQAGEVFVLLKEPAEAEPLLRRALAAQRPDLVQQTASTRGNLALSLALAGDVPEASRVGIEVSQLHDQCPCQWVRRQLLTLHRMTKDSRDPAAVELRERLVAV